MPESGQMHSIQRLSWQGATNDWNPFGTKEGCGPSLLSCVFLHIEVKVQKDYALSSMLLKGMMLCLCHENAGINGQRRTASHQSKDAHAQQISSIDAVSFVFNLFLLQLSSPLSALTATSCTSIALTLSREKVRHRCFPN